MSNEEEMVTITKFKYNSLVERDNWLECLEQAGVDNWSGYEYAQEIQSEEE